MPQITPVSATPKHQRYAGIGDRTRNRPSRTEFSANCTEVKMASMAPTRAVAGRAAIQPNSTKIGMSAAINISKVVIRGNTPNR